MPLCATSPSCELSTWLQYWTNMGILSSQRSTWYSCIKPVSGPNLHSHIQFPMAPTQCALMTDYPTIGKTSEMLEGKPAFANAPEILGSAFQFPPFLSTPFAPISCPALSSWMCIPHCECRVRDFVTWSAPQVYPLSPRFFLCRWQILTKSPTQPHACIFTELISDFNPLLLPRGSYLENIHDIDGLREGNPCLLGKWKRKIRWSNHTALPWLHGLNQSSLDIHR